MFAVEAGHSHKAVSILIDKKLALFEEAMKHNPDNEVQFCTLHSPHTYMRCLFSFAFSVSAHVLWLCMDVHGWMDLSLSLSL